jgi:hypothetical protein
MSSVHYRACCLAILAAGVAVYAACNPAWVSYYLPLLQRKRGQASDEDSRDSDSDADLEVPVCVHHGSGSSNRTQGM